MSTELDVIVIGAGPVGLACAIEASRRGLSVRVIEKGALVNSLTGYPTNMEFFSTPELLEIGDYPFATHRYKPLREEAIDYYRRVAEAENLDIHLYESVERLDGACGDFSVITSSDVHRTRHVIVCTGFFDQPNLMGIPGEDLPKVTHYFREPFRYTGQRVLVIGAKNSAAKAALQCFRHGADVTLAVRGPELSQSIKYWIRPDLANRIADGSIRAHFDTSVTSIAEGHVDLLTKEGPVRLENDWVLAMTGYRPDYGLLDAIGIRADRDEARTPLYDPDTFETNRHGVYIAGTVCGGLHTSRWFIENGRHHAAVIADTIASRDQSP